MRCMQIRTLALRRTRSFFAGNPDSRTWMEKHGRFGSLLLLLTRNSSCPFVHLMFIWNLMLVCKTDPDSDSGANQNSCPKIFSKAWEEPRRGSESNNTETTSSDCTIPSDQTAQTRSSECQTSCKRTSVIGKFRLAKISCDFSLPKSRAIATWLGLEPISTIHVEFRHRNLPNPPFFDSRWCPAKFTGQWFVRQQRLGQFRVVDGKISENLAACFEALYMRGLLFILYYRGLDQSISRN